MHEGNKGPGRQMKVSELSRESETAPSAIHYYVQLGVLHRPTKVGLNLHLYDESHLTKLRQIRQLKEKKGLSLTEIKKVLEARKTGTGPGPLTDGKVEKGEAVDASDGEREGRENREKILDMAIKLFSEGGYENTKVSDITEALRMGKGTFYVYFKNKRELFMECIDRLGVAMVPRESWDEIRKEQDYVRRNRKRAVVFLRAFPGYRGILNMVRGAMGGRDPVLAQKATEAFRVLSRPMLKDLRRAIADGTVRIKHDEAFVAYLHLILAEGLGYWQMIDSRYSVEEGMEILMDIILHGMVDTHPSDPGAGIRQQGPQGEVEYGKGTKARFQNISIDGEYALRGRMGDAEVDVALKKLAVARFQAEGGRQLATLTTEEGQQLEVTVDGEHQLWGTAPFGSIRIPLKRIISVCFGEG